MDEVDNGWGRVSVGNTTFLLFTQIYSEELLPHSKNQKCNKNKSKFHLNNFKNDNFVLMNMSSEFLSSQKVCNLGTFRLATGQ